MSAVQLSIKDRIAILTLNRPPANALSSEVLEALSARLDEVEGDERVKAVVIHGDGRFFSAGADIKEFAESGDSADFSALAKKGQALFNRIESMKKPVIAAIHGAALGGGLELAMACHIRIVEEGAKLGLPELQLGLIPGFAGTQRLPRIVGVARAAEMMLTSAPISAQEAYQFGLANRVAAEGRALEEALNLAAKIVEKSAVSVRALFECLAYARSGAYEAGMAKEAENFGKVFRSRDAEEGIRAFIEKRKPNFLDH